jgi:hypothetical protein
MLLGVASRNTRTARKYLGAGQCGVLLKVSEEGFRQHVSRFVVRIFIAPRTAIRLAEHEPAGRVAIARFFAENVAVLSGGLEHAVTEGADAVLGAESVLAS